MAVNFSMDVEDIDASAVRLTVEAGAPVEFRGAVEVEGNSAVCTRGSTVHFRVAESGLWLRYDVPSAMVSAAFHGWQMATGA